MTPAYDTPHHIELISSSHAVSFFDCESEYLTHYLQTLALANTQRDYERTFVCVVEDVPDSEAIAGYFSLRASTYSFGYTVVPVVEIFALARHIARKGQDWGNILLSEALAKIVEASECIGISGVQLNPTDQGVRLYREFGFSEHPLAGNSNKMFLPMRMIPPL